MWQRRLRYALVVFLVLLIGAVAVSLRGRREAPVGVPAPAEDPHAVVVAPKGADVVWTDKGREVFTLSFERSLTYADGRSVFAGVRVRVPQEDGRHVDITAKEAEVRTPAGQPRQVVLRGDVVIRASDGLELRAAEATYAEETAVMNVPGAFTFSRARLSGTGREGLYDQRAELFSIGEAADMTVAAGEAGAEPLQVRAHRATMARRERLLRFDGNAHVTSGEQTIDADLLTAYLTDDEQHLSRLELRGASRVSSAAGGPGSLRLMQARDIDLRYAPDGRTLQRADLRGRSVLEIAGTTAASRRLAAETIELDLTDDGRTLTQVSAQQDVRLDLPEEEHAPGQRISSAALVGRGSAETGGLRDVTFTGDVAYRETRGSRQGTDRTARSDRLDAVLGAGFGAPERATFRGRTTIKDGQTMAEAGVAVYAPGREVMTLETPAGVAGPPPRVVDDQVTVSAQWIEMTLGSRRLSARGDVRSLLQARSPRSSQTGTAAGERRLPTMLTEEEPVNVTATELQYDGDLSQGVYTGNARLWQGDTSIQADVITLDDRAGNLTATRQVRSRMLVERAGDDGRREQVETIGTANHLVYDDAARRATYTGNARLSGPQGEVRGPRIELFLAADGRTLDRVEAYEQVAVRLQGGEHASGTRLTYYGADERYVMHGTPVKIEEIIEGGCRETSGASLTFLRSTDTITVVGTEGNRSRTTPRPCAERP
jgi:lipopolysaccharide transport protein LptA